MGWLAGSVPRTLVAIPPALGTCPVAGTGLQSARGSLIPYPRRCKTPAPTPHPASMNSWCFSTRSLGTALQRRRRLPNAPWERHQPFRARPGETEGLPKPHARCWQRGAPRALPAGLGEQLSAATCAGGFQGRRGGSGRSRAHLQRGCARSWRRAAAGARPWQRARSCCLLGFTAVYVETWLGEGKRGDGGEGGVRGVGGTVPVPVSLAFSFLSPPPPPPRSLHALKSHFQARHRINLWALHIAGSAKQDVGSFFSLSLRLG